MKKVFITLLFTLNFLVLGAQTGIKFKIEDLSQPESLLEMTSGQMVVDLLISETSRISMEDLKKDSLLLATSDIPESLVYYSTHPFFEGMREAFAHHRPFVLSPDMIWLLICQGFSQHVNANSEALRDQIVDYEGKLSLVVYGGEQFIEEINWKDAIPQFTEQIKHNTKGNIAETIMADFTTTTPTELIATEITLMEAVQDYFEYIYIMLGCGIPEITLLGTPDDWQKVYDKALSLEQYQLDWWINELEPILSQFVLASKGTIDIEFWKAMFRTHSQEGYGAPDLIDGWFVKFFPYDAGGKQMNLKNIPDNAINKLPNEIASADVLVINKKTNEKMAVELCAGFIGLEQNSTNFSLTPKIGWFVKRKTSNDNKDYKQLKRQMEYEGIQLRIKEVPEVLNRFESFSSLSLTFINEVFMPEWMSTKAVDNLSIYGSITNDERDKILAWYPDAGSIHINGVTFHKKGEQYDVSVNAFADTPPIFETIDGIHNIDKMTVNNNFTDADGRCKRYSIQINPTIDVNINSIEFKVRPSLSELNSLKRLLPNTKVKYNNTYLRLRIDDRINRRWIQRENKKFQREYREQQKKQGLQN